MVSEPRASSGMPAPAGPTSPLALPGLDPVETLVNEVAQVTGLELPSLLSEDAPTLSLNSNPSSGPAFYLIGLIGGKDVGKSTLAHAIAGVTRDLRGRQLVAVRGHPEKLEVSRTYAGLFKGM